MVAPEQHDIDEQATQDFALAPQLADPSDNEPTAHLVIHPVAPQPEVPTELPPPTAHASKGFVRRTGGVASAVTMFGALAGGAYALHEAPDLDLKAVDVAAIGREGIAGLELGAPWLLGATGFGTLVMARNRSGRTRLTLAARGLSAHDATKGGMQRVLAGAALPAVTATSFATGFMIDQGIRDNPNQSVESIAGSVQRAAGEDQAVTWAFKPGTKHFMNQSFIAQDTVNQVRAGADDSPITSVSVYKTDLTTVPTANNPDQAGLKVAVENAPGQPSPATPEVEADAICEIVQERCVLGPHDLIVDSGEGLAIGDTVEIHDDTYTVVAHPQQAQSLLNRLTVYSGLSQEEREEGYSGMVAISPSTQDVETLIAQLGLEGKLDTQTTEELKQYNEEFWSGNGTPLIVVLEAIACTLGMGIALKLARDERNNARPQLATMSAIGFSRGDVAKVRAARATLNTAKGAAVALPAQMAIEKVVDSIMPGFDVTLQPQTVGASAALILGMQLAGGVMRQKRTLAEEMRQR